MQFELSWALNHDDIATWQQGRTAGASRSTSSATATRSSPGNKNSVEAALRRRPAWTSDAGPGGWNNLDSLDVGNGQMDGITDAERQSYMTLWAIEAAPLFTG